MRRVSVALLLALTACADAQDPAAPTVSAPAVSADPVVVVDGRPDAEGAEAQGAGEWEGHAVIVEAVGLARAHWLGQDPQYDEEARVLDVAEGAFTEPQAREHAVLYLMSLWPRCCPKVGLAIVGGDGQLVRNVAFEGSVQEVRTVPGFGDGGRDGLALVGSFGMGGHNEGSATIVAFGPEGLASRGGVGIYESGCAAGQEGESAARLVMSEGPSLRVERFRRATCDGTWEPVGEAEPFVPAEPSGEGYVELHRG